MPFSQQHADAACNFFEIVLKHTADQYYGKPFLLAPWQEEAISTIFGNLDDEGRRIIEQVYLEVAKKNGKTEFAAGILLLCAVLETQPGCQVYGAGAALRQAGNVYRAACKMVEQSPVLKKRLRLLRSTHRIIKKRDPDSFYAAIAADGDLSDGVNPSVVVADELHRWRTRKQIENWDVLSLGGITRRETLTIAITTAGVQEESPLAWRLHEKTIRLRQGIVEDPTFYGRIYAADPEDDWTDEKTWIKANPSLIENGGFLPLERIREKYQSALSDPAAQFAFQRYHLNLWGKKENRIIAIDKWDKSAGDWKAMGLLKKPPEDKVRPIHSDMMGHFIDRECWAGLDMSMTTDMSALVFVFPREDGGFDWLPFIWLPSANLKQREIRDGVPYRLWEQQGFLEVCDAHGGEFIDQTVIEERIRWGMRTFDLQELCYDPWNAHAMIGRLSDEGLTCIEVRQGYASLTAPSKKFLELVTAEKLYHGGHPVLRWNASCLSSKEHNDNLMFAKPDRMKTSARIDGISAGINGMTRAIAGDTGTIEYRGLRSIG